MPQFTVNFKPDILKYTLDFDGNGNLSINPDATSYLLPSPFNTNIENGNQYTTAGIPADPLGIEGTYNSGNGFPISTLKVVITYDGLNEEYTLSLQDDDFQPVDANTNLPMTFVEEGAPCLTKTCNILTPDGYKNISTLKKGDEIITDKNKTVKIKNILKTVSLNPPRLISKNSYGNNLPMIDTHLSDYHAFQVNNKWKLPIKSDLTLQSIDNNKFTEYYHLQLPNYFEDNLVVNGLVMEGWDGKMPHEPREYQWERVGKSFKRVPLN